MPGTQRLGAVSHSLKCPCRIKQILDRIRCGTIEMLSPQFKPQITSEDPRAVAHTCGVEGLTWIGRLIEHRAGHLAVVRPGPSVEIVRTHHGPHVINHDYLGVHVDRRACGVFDVIDAEALATRGAADLDCSLMADQARPAGRPLPVGEAGHDRDHMQFGIRLHRAGEQLGDERRPQVLILDVDQAPCAGKCLPVGVRDAAFTQRREGVAPKPGRVGPQHLHGVGPCGRRIGQRLRKVAAGECAGVIGAVHQHPDRTGQLQHTAAVPPLAKGLLHVADGRATDRDLRVMPGRTIPVFRRKVHRLHIATVGGVVVSTPAKVDATHECDVLSRPVGASEDDEFLMMGSGTPGTGVQQHIATRLVDVAGQLGVLALAAFEPVRLRTPDQPENHYAGTRAITENSTDRGIRTGQKFLGVAPKVGEIDFIAAMGRAQLLIQTAEIRRAVDERLDRIPRGPSADISRPITALGSREEPPRHNVRVHSTVLVRRHDDQCWPSDDLPASNAARSVSRA